MKQTLQLINGDGLGWLGAQEKNSCFILTDCPLEIKQRDIYRAARVYMIYGGPDYLVTGVDPDMARIPGEKFVQPYRTILDVLPQTTICDPFMGTGTIGEAALRSGHSFIGVEIDPERYKICVERLDPIWKALCNRT